MFAHVERLYNGGQQNVQINTEDLNEEHDAILNGSTYLRIVTDFIKNTSV